MLLPRLKEKREAAEMTHENLASISMMTARNIQLIEKGRATTLNTAKRLAKGLKCKLEDLV